MTTPYPVPTFPMPGPQQLRLPSHPRATTSLVLGIIGVAGFFVLLVPVLMCPLAWYYGALARREAEREPTRWADSSEAKAGLILGLIGSALLAALLLFLTVVASLSIVTSRYDAGYGT